MDAAICANLKNAITKTIDSLRGLGVALDGVLLAEFGSPDLAPLEAPSITARRQALIDSGRFVDATVARDCFASREAFTAWMRVQPLAMVFLVGERVFVHAQARVAGGRTLGSVAHAKARRGGTMRGRPPVAGGWCEATWAAFFREIFDARMPLAVAVDRAETQGFGARPSNRTLRAAVREIRRDLSQNAAEDQPE